MATLSSAAIYIVCALSCEARPLIDYFKLRKRPGHLPFALFECKDQRIVLVVSGVGKINAAAAVSYLYQQGGELTYGCYLNLGIAGGCGYPIGTLLAANKIIDQASAKAYYPSWLPVGMASAALLTMDQPQQQYPDEGLVDMEAAGFFAIAARMVAQEQVQVIKIVSDNSPQSLQHVSAAKVTQLMEQQLAAVVPVIEASLTRSASEAYLYESDTGFSELLAYCHFSVYQQSQLRELLRRWAQILPEKKPMAIANQHCRAVDVLEALSLELDQASYQW